MGRVESSCCLLAVLYLLPTLLNRLLGHPALSDDTGLSFESYFMTLAGPIYINGPDHIMHDIFKGKHLKVWVDGHP